jgi:hypothetical protein
MLAGQHYDPRQVRISSNVVLPHCFSGLVMARRGVTAKHSRKIDVARKPEPSRPTKWTIYKLAAKQMRLDVVEAPDEATAMEKAAAESNVPANRPMAIRR